MTITPEAVETLARAMCVALGENPDDQWDISKKYRWQDREPFARQHLAAMQATEAMKAEPSDEDEDFHPATGKDAVVWCGADRNPYISLKAIQALVPKLTAIEEPAVEPPAQEAPAPVTDQEIIDRCAHLMLKEGWSPRNAAREAIRITRAQSPAKLSPERVEEIVDEVYMAGKNDTFGKAVRHALKLAGCM